jgi:hypothetical protein
VPTDKGEVHTMSIGTMLPVIVLVLFLLGRL